MSENLPVLEEMIKTDNPQNNIESQNKNETEKNIIETETKNNIQEKPISPEEIEIKKEIETNNNNNNNIDNNNNINSNELVKVDQIITNNNEKTDNNDKQKIEEKKNENEKEKNNNIMNDNNNNNNNIGVGNVSITIKNEIENNNNNNNNHINDNVDENSSIKINNINNINNITTNITNNNSSLSIITDYKKKPSKERRFEEDIISISNINSNRENSNRSKINCENDSVITLEQKSHITDKKPINKRKNKNASEIKNNKSKNNTLYDSPKNIRRREQKKNANHHIIKNSSMDNKVNSSRDSKFSETYKRFIEDQKKKKLKIIQMKKNKEEKEKNLCYNKPKINKKSQEIISKTKEDFYTRQKRSLEEQKRKEAILRERIKKKELDDINRTNILLTRNKDMNKKRRKNSMDDKVKDFYDWDKKRKERLMFKIKNKEKSMKEICRHKPKIDKNSYKITINRNPDQIFNRLYKDDVIRRKEKKKLLEDIYTPTFRPNLIDEKNKHNKSTISYNMVTNTNYNTIKNKEENDSYLEKYYENYHEDEELNDMIRDHIFGKGKKTRCNTSMSMDVKRHSSVKDTILHDDNYKYNSPSYTRKKMVYFSPSPGRTNYTNNKTKIKIKKNLGYLMSEFKNKNKSEIL